MANFDPNQPRNEDGEWTIAGSSAWKAAGLTPKNVLAKGDETELYRWANLQEIIETSRHKRVNSLDVTEKPDWYFAPHKVLTNPTPVETVYGRFILDREILINGGWSKDPHLTVEGAWRWKSTNIGDLSDSQLAFIYNSSIIGFEIVDLPDTLSAAQVSEILEYRLKRSIPVIVSTAKEITDFEKNGD